MLSFICQTVNTILHFILGPLCLENSIDPEKHITSTTSSSFTFTMSGSLQARLCVKLQNTSSHECKPFDGTSVNFEGLDPDTSYLLGIFTYVTDSDEYKILSGHPCKAFTIYTSEFWSHHDQYTFTSIYLMTVVVPFHSFYCLTGLFFVLWVYSCRMFWE